MHDHLKNKPTKPSKKVIDNPFLKKTKMSIGLVGIFYFGGQLLGLYRLDREFDIKIGSVLLVLLVIVELLRMKKQKAAGLSSITKKVEDDANDGLI